MDSFRVILSGFIRLDSPRSSRALQWTLLPSWFHERSNNDITKFRSLPDESRERKYKDDSFLITGPKNIGSFVEWWKYYSFYKFYILCACFPINKDVTKTLTSH